MMVKIPKRSSVLRPQIMEKKQKKQQPWNNPDLKSQLSCVSPPVFHIAVGLIHAIPATRILF